MHLRTLQHRGFFGGEAREVGSGARRRCRAFRSSDSKEPGEGSSIGLDDWRAFRARLVSESDNDVGPWNSCLTAANFHILKDQNPDLAAEGLWAHPVAIPETGGLLLATTAGHALLPSEYWQAVVLLVSLSKEEGCVGYILNRPTSLTMAKLPLALDSSTQRSELCSVFPDNRVYCGGLDQQDRVSILHGVHDLQEYSTEVMPGLYLGGRSAVVTAVKERKFERGHFKFFAGQIQWGPGELEAELMAGAWRAAACSRAVLLKGCIQLPVPLWVEVSRLMGGEAAAEAAAVYEDFWPR